MTLPAPERSPGSTPVPRAAAGLAAARASLAVEAGGLGFLLPLPQAGEIFPLTEVLPVAHTKPWFLGVANLRGGLHGVVDLAAFLGLPSAVPAVGGGQGGGAASAMPPSVPGSVQATSADHARARHAGRLLAVNPELRALCALRVDNLCGLRRMDDSMQPVPQAGPCPSFAAGVWRDAQGRLWQELDLERLVASEAFLAIGVVASPSAAEAAQGAAWA